MKIAVHTNGRLVLRHFPLGMIAVMLVLALGMIAGLFSADAPESLGARAGLGGCAIGLLWITHRYFPLTDTVFDRAAGVVVHAERRLTGQRLRSWPLAEIDGAQIEANWSGNSRGTRLTLQVDGRREPLEYGFGPGDLRPLETAVNAWLTQAQP